MDCDLLKIISTRRSVRSFEPCPLTAADREALLDDIRSVTSPGDTDCLIRIADIDTGNDFKPSTYGVIKNARTYIVMAQGNTATDRLWGAYRLECIVLQAWHRGLGTCWLGGTRKVAPFRRAADIPDDKNVDIVMPVGYPAEKRFVERFMRRMVSSDSRKPFDKLFFDGNFDTPLSPDSGFATSLQMVRRAPSASNGQPWKALVDKDGLTVHFFCKSGRFADFDMGIALAHFDLAEKAQHYGGTFMPLDIDSITVPDNLTYVISYTRKL